MGIRWQHRPEAQQRSVTAKCRVKKSQRKIERSYYYRGRNTGVLNTIQYTQLFGGLAACGPRLQLDAGILLVKEMPNIIQGSQRYI